MAFRAASSSYFLMALQKRPQQEPEQCSHWKGSENLFALTIHKLLTWYRARHRGFHCHFVLDLLHSGFVYVYLLLT